MCPEKGFKWQKLKIKTLGVWLSIEPDLIVNLNFDEKKKKKKSEIFLETGSIED